MQMDPEAREKADIVWKGIVRFVGGAYLHNLDEQTQMQEEIRAIVQCVPEGLSYCCEESEFVGVFMLPIHSAMHRVVIHGYSYTLDKDYSTIENWSALLFVLLLLQEGMKQDFPVNSFGQSNDWIFRLSPDEENMEDRYDRGGLFSFAVSISGDEKTKLEGAIDETLQWLDSNLSVEKKEYEKRQKALEAIAVPLFEHLKALETDKCLDNEETNSAHQCTDEIVVSEQSKSIGVTVFDKSQEEKTIALTEWILVEIIKFNSANVRLQCKEYTEELIKLGFYDREMMKNFCTVEIIDSKEFTSFMKLAHRLSLKKWLLEHGAST